MFKVGDTVHAKKPVLFKDGHSLSVGGAYGTTIEVVNMWRAPAIITEMTERGFKYKFVIRQFMGTRIGWCDEGETFMPEQYELAEQQEMGF